MIYVSAYTGDDSIPLFLSFAIEQYKHYKKISGEEAAEMLSQTGVLQHLQDNYEVLHTQSSQWLMEEIDEMVNNNNKKA